MVGVGEILGVDRGVPNESIAGYALHLVSAWAQNGLMEIPGSRRCLDAVSGENIFLSFHYLYEDEFLGRLGGGQHLWK